MKKLILFAAAALTITMMGCKGGSSDPKGVLTSFFDALSKKDIKGAKQYATKESEGMLQLMEMGMNAGGDKEDKFNKADLEIGSATITGDKATIPVKNKKSGETTNYTLKKEGGSWKVAFDKSTLTQDAADKMKGMNNTNDNPTNSDNNMNTDSTQMTDDSTHQ